ncbi:MAG: hypothetical protein ACO1SX_08510 [Actinomycetota bacterium]
MDKLAQLGLQPVLDALDGIAYITSANDVIMAYGRPNWDRFASENLASHLTRPEEVLGRSLWDFITGPQAQLAHQTAAELVRSEGNPSVTYTYRCDAPDVRRELRMSITPILEMGNLSGMLYQSVTLSEAARPPVRILSPLRTPTAHSQQVISICSYCRCIRQFPEPAEPVWITPEEYYELGLDDGAQVSHGICPDCWETIVQPMISELRTLNADTDREAGPFTGKHPSWRIASN